MADHELPATSHAAAPAAFSSDDLQRVAAEHEVLPETVLRSLVGLPVRGRAGARAHRAAAKLRSGGR